MLGLIGSVTGTRVLSCQILFNSRWVGVCFESNWLLFPLLNYGCVYISLVFSVFYTWTLFQLQRCQPWFLLFLSTSYWVFLLNSGFHQWSMFYHCFILTIGQLPYHSFPLTVDPWGLLGVKKALKCCPQFTPLGSSLPGLGSIYLYESSSGDCVQWGKSLWS